MEEFRDIPGYEGYYEVSNLGNVRGVDRSIMCGGRLRFIKGKLLAKRIINKYYGVNLYKNGMKTYNIHQLEAMAFLNHIPSGNTIVVDHVNGNKLDNRLENLRLISNRENTNCRGGVSKYKGVYWDRTKWKAQVSIKGKRKNLGRYTHEEEAHEAYQKALKDLEN